MLSDYWYVWPIGIALWALLGWIEFGYFESNAIKNPSPNRPTLSYFIYYLSSKFPLALCLGSMMIGGFICGLAVHFFWHWCPPGSISAG